MQQPKRRFKTYGSVLCIPLILILLWSLFYNPKPSRPPEPEYYDKGIVMYKHHEKPKGSAVWKPVLIVDCISGTRRWLYTSEEIYGKYNHQDSIAFRWPQKLTRIYYAQSPAQINILNRIKANGKKNLQ